MPNPTEQRSPLWNKDFILLCLTNLAIFSSFQMLMPILPVYLVHLGGNDVIVGLATGIFTVSALIARPFVGRAMDRRGRRVFYLSGLAVLILASLGYTLAGVIWAIMLIRLLQGPGWATATTAATAIVTDLVPARRRMEGISYFSLFAMMAMAFAPALGMQILGSGRYRAVFLTSAGLAVLALLISTRIKMPPLEVHTGTPGALYEATAWLPSTVVFFVAITYAGITSFLPLFAAGLRLAYTGLFFTVYGVSVILVRLLAGRVADRRGDAVVVIPAMVSVILALLMLALTRNVWMLLGSAVLYGLGFGAVNPVLQAVAVAEVPPNRRGAAIATYFSAFDVGMGLGAVIQGVIAHTAGYRWMYAVSIGFGLAGLVIYLLFRWKQPRVDLRRP